MVLEKKRAVKKNKRILLNGLKREANSEKRERKGGKEEGMLFPILLVFDRIEEERTETC